MEKFSLYLFWTCMLLCAGTFLMGIWIGESAPEELFKFVATFFVVGLASFLVWLPLTVIRFVKQ